MNFQSEARKKKIKDFVSIVIKEIDQYCVIKGFNAFFPNPGFKRIIDNGKILYPIEVERSPLLLSFFSSAIYMNELEKIIEEFEISRKIMYPIFIVEKLSELETVKTSAKEMKINIYEISTIEELKKCLYSNII
jgi:hypothetical protein